MKHPLLLLILTLLITGLTRAQKAWPGDIRTLMAEIPIPGTSATCYAACTKTTDPSNGMISIKDNGVQFTAFEARLNNIMKDAMTSVSTAPTGATRTAATATTASDATLMRTIGQAQMAASHINQLCNELTMKMTKLSKDAVQAVKQGPNCPEVQQGGYAGPTCACLTARALDYYTRRVTAMDDYVSQVAALIREYLAKIKAEAAVVDDMEAKAKYGDAVANPAFKQMAVSIQSQSFAGIAILLSLSSGTWKDGATEYSNELNAKSGASVGCNGK